MITNTYEWETEPDEEKFEHEGYFCLILRNCDPGFGHLNGYVKIPPKHPWRKKIIKGGTDFSYLSCHGGLTFSGMLPDYCGHWVGFDCGHFSDLKPYFESFCLDEAKIRMPAPPWPVSYKNIKYVRNEIISLVEQLKALEKKNVYIEFCRRTARKSWSKICNDEKD